VDLLDFVLSISYLNGKRAVLIYILGRPWLPFPMLPEKHPHHQYLPLDRMFVPHPVFTEMVME